MTDADLDRAQTVADGLAGAKVHKTGQDLIEDPDVDAVVVASWGPTHEEFVLAGIAAGKQVFCEKPLATTWEAGDRIVDAEVATGRRVPQLPQGLAGGASRVVFSRDGRMVAAASGDGIRLWEVATWKLRTTFHGHRDGVLSLHFAADGRLFSGSADTTVLAWDVYPQPATDATPK